MGGLVGAVILFLCFLFGRRVDRSTVPWLDGPTGPPRIGTGFHRSVAARAGLEVNTGSDLGLLPDCAFLDGDGFDSGRLHPSVRDFYEHTGRYHLDVWSQWSPLFWPFGWMLINFVSRRMEQLNFPMYPLETARGMTSEVEQLMDQSGRVAFTSWLRRNLASGLVIYSGFYSTATPPGSGPCVKTVFPVVRGNATVLLRPEAQTDGSSKQDRGVSECGTCARSRKSFTCIPTSTAQFAPTTSCVGWACRCSICTTTSPRRKRYSELRRKPGTRIEPE